MDAIEQEVSVCHQHHRRFQERHLRLLWRRQALQRCCQQLCCCEWVPFQLQGAAHSRPVRRIARHPWSNSSRNGLRTISAVKTHALRLSSPLRISRSRRTVQRRLRSSISSRLVLLPSCLCVSFRQVSVEGGLIALLAELREYP